MPGCSRPGSIRSSSAADSSCSYSQHVVGKTFEVIVHNELVTALADWEPSLAISKSFRDAALLQRARATLEGNPHFQRLFDQCHRERQLKTSGTIYEHFPGKKMGGCAFTEVEADVFGTVLPKPFPKVAVKKNTRITVVGHRWMNHQELTHQQWPHAVHVDGPLDARTGLLVVEATSNPVMRCLHFKLCQLERFLTVVLEAASPDGRGDKNILKVVVAAAIATQRAPDRSAGALAYMIFKNKSALPLIYDLYMANRMLLVSIEATQVDYLSGLANQVQDMTGMLDMAAEDMDNYKFVSEVQEEELKQVREQLEEAQQELDATKQALQDTQQQLESTKVELQVTKAQLHSTQLAAKAQETELHRAIKRLNELEDLLLQYEMQGIRIADTAEPEPTSELAHTAEPFSAIASHLLG